MLTLSLTFQAARIIPPTTPVAAIPGQPESGSISASIFFTDPTLNMLPRDGHGNPMVNATIGLTQTCTGYTPKHHQCENPREWYVVQRTSPTQIRAWINITNTSGSPLRALKLNETLPHDWAVSPGWGKLTTQAIHDYWTNTTRLDTGHELTQYPTVTVGSSTPQVVHIIIPDFNKTAIAHLLLPHQSILVSVTLTYTPVGARQSLVSYPKNYTDTATIGAWNQTSFKGTGFTKNASGFFTTYGPIPVTTPAPTDFWGPIFDVAAPLIGLAIILTIIFLVMSRLRRAKQQPDFPNSRPLAA